MLKRLVPSSSDVEVQETSFTLDIPGRYVCNTWEEATVHAGAGFDAVVLGAGMFGAYCAEKLYRRGADRNARVLVLEGGPFLVSEHVQNLARIGLNVPSATLVDPGVPRERVWGLPWRSNEKSPGLAYCVGGRSLYWGGWAPRLTDDDLALWPAELASYLRARYPAVEREIGVEPSTDFIVSEGLYPALLARTQAVLPNVSNLIAAGEAPIAVQGSAPASGLFSFDKFSSAPILVDAIREAATAPDGFRRLFLVVRSHVTRLLFDGQRVHAIEVHVDGRQQTLPLKPGAAVVLALGAIESTRLALLSFPNPLMGRNLMAHTRTNLTVRIRRSVFAGLPPKLQTAALMVRGAVAGGRFHLQLTASASGSFQSDDLLFRMIPDIDLLDQQLASQSPDWIAITCRALGEMEGDQVTPVPNAARSWINLSPYELDEFGVPRAWVQLVASNRDRQIWRGMEDAALALLQRIGGMPQNIEYLHSGGWTSNAPSRQIIEDQWRDGLGTTHHEAGTLWMGTNASTSVTNALGRFHHVENAYVADLSLLPAVGSANPALTGLTMAGRVAGVLAQ